MRLQPGRPSYHSFRLATDATRRLFPRLPEPGMHFEHKHFSTSGERQHQWRWLDWYSFAAIRTRPRLAPPGNSKQWPTGANSLHRVNAKTLTPHELESHPPRDPGWSPRRSVDPHPTTAEP